MMKKILLTILSMGVFSMGASSANATPTYYTFSGTINWIADGGMIQNGDVSIAFGDPVSYTWMIDFDRRGSTTLNNGTVITGGMYYNDIVSGLLLHEVNGGFYNAPAAAAEYNYTIDSTTDALTGGSDDHFIQIYNIANLTALSVGDTGMSSYERAFDDQGHATRFQSFDLRVTRIADSAPAQPSTPTPIPGAVWLMSSGLAGLVGLRRKKRENNA